MKRKVTLLIAVCMAFMMCMSSCEPWMMDLLGPDHGGAPMHDGPGGGGPGGGGGGGHRR
jgi:hypothetical protein